YVERAQPVGHDQRPLAVAHVAVAHLPLVLLTQLGQVGGVQGLRQLRANRLFVDLSHEVSSSLSARSMIAPVWRRWCCRSKARSISPAVSRWAMSASAASSARTLPSPSTAAGALRSTSS